tara:strand:+ start:1442 stop:2128 length:687 start_codon:yes stop_codon:yes gene_type:complete
MEVPILILVIAFILLSVSSFKEELSKLYSSVFDAKSPATSSIYRSLYFTLLFVIIVVILKGYDIRRGFDLIGYHKYLGNGYYDSYFYGQVRYLFAHNLLYYFIVIVSLEAAYHSSIIKNTLIRIPLGILFHLFFVATLLLSNVSLSGPYVGYSIYTVLITHGLLIFLYYIFTVLRSLLKKSSSLKNIYDRSFLKGFYSESLLGLYIRNKKAELRRKLEEEKRRLEKDE